MSDRRMYQWPGPGKVDNEGVEWFACDPYITWYRWEGGELYTDPPPEVDKLTDEEYEAAKESNRKYWSEDEHTL